MLSQSNLFCRFYSEYKQRHKDEYQSDISHPYKYPDSWRVCQGSIFTSHYKGNTLVIFHESCLQPNHFMKTMKRREMRGREGRVIMKLRSLLEWVARIIIPLSTSDEFFVQINNEKLSGMQGRIFIMIELHLLGRLLAVTPVTTSLSSPSHGSTGSCLLYWDINLWWQGYKAGGSKEIREQLSGNEFCIWHLLSSLSL